ncbi:hypothetical protein GQX73_g6034 [Xylaria multiplex]|uniref:Uncharacterized protein n=1 Tax=Xylaria multiplex TaxID=323545 RepID=A0A7C8MSV3_9PEZI|nr:hypothetical protein GQX73_g6034 [Xylaria multiplex]
MGGQFSPQDPARCHHYARFASSLNRTYAEALYWTLFFLVVVALFFSSWIFQWTMKYRDSPTFTVDKFRKKLSTSLGLTLAIFLIAVVMLVIEVYALLALQFCDGEDLMSLYWATWTILQVGSEIAILGVSLALWHHLWDMEHPLWALALGTPVLVVAGLGHLLSLVLRQFYQKAKARRLSLKAPSTSYSVEGPVLSSHTTEQTQVNDEKHPTRVLALEQGQSVYFAMDIGDDERIRQWPCIVGMVDGKAVVRMTAVPEPAMTRALK